MVWLQSRHIRRWFSRFKYTVCIKLKKEVKYEESLYIFSRNGNYIWNFWLWKEYIVFPFSASDVVKIETYYSNSEADTKEKTLTEEADIDYLYTFFSELPVKDANSDSTNDGSTIKFVFDLSDGTNYELVYIGIATKKGYLQSETSDFYYFTSSDIIGVWANLSKMRLDF